MFFGCGWKHSLQYTGSPGFGSKLIVAGWSHAEHGTVTRRGFEPRVFCGRSRWLSAKPSSFSAP